MAPLASGFSSAGQGRTGGGLSATAHMTAQRAVAIARFADVRSGNGRSLLCPDFGEIPGPNAPPSQPPRIGVLELVGESLDHAGVGGRVDAELVKAVVVAHEGAASCMVVAGGMVPRDDEVVGAL